MTSQEKGRQSENVHYLKLPASQPGDVFFQEWDVYRREVGRWLAEGLDGKYVLIKDHVVAGTFDTWEEAQRTGLRRFASEPFFVHPIREEEPSLRVRGVNFPWPNRLTR